MLSMSFLVLFIWNMGHPAGIFLQPEVIAALDIHTGLIQELLANILSLLTDRQLHPKALYQ